VISRIENWFGIPRDHDPTFHLLLDARIELECALKSVESKVQRLPRNASFQESLEHYNRTKQCYSFVLRDNHRRIGWGRNAVEAFIASGLAAEGAEDLVENIEVNT
jgi:hypothetical protein